VLLAPFETVPRDANHSQLIEVDTYALYGHRDIMRVAELSSPAAVHRVTHEHAMTTRQRGQQCVDRENREMKEAASAMVEALEDVARDQARYYADTKAGLHADRSHWYPSLAEIQARHIVEEDANN
jgi:hypothetical protein